jgi:hypothetical protein
MSAFICNPKQVTLLAAYYGVGRTKYGHGDGLEIAQEAARKLWAQNVRSVRHRYPEDDYDSLPGPVPCPINVVVSNADMDAARRADPKAILKWCECLAYQSCETDDWRTTEAFDIVEETKDFAIWNLPGFEEIPWTMDEAA